MVLCWLSQEPGFYTSACRDVLDYGGSRCTSPFRPATSSTHWCVNVRASWTICKRRPTLHRHFALVFAATGPFTVWPTCTRRPIICRDRCHFLYPSIRSNYRTIHTLSIHQCRSTRPILSCVFLSPSIWWNQLIFLSRLKPFSLFIFFTFCLIDYHDIFSVSSTEWKEQRLDNARYPATIDVTSKNKKPTPKN